MSTYMLVSCGTSVLTNRSDEPTRQRFARLANERELGAEDRRWLQEQADTVWRRLQAGDLEEARRQSAEVNSLAAFFRGLPSTAGRPDELVLLHSDTALGLAAAEILQKWLQEQGCPVRLHTTPGLATRNLEEFQQSLADLVRWAWEEIPAYREAGYRVVFNLTGGFKGILGFLQVLGTLMADETVYLFEGGGDLLRIPRLPVKLNTEDTVRQHLQTFRRMAVLGSAPAAECAGLPETLYFRCDDLADLTAWGAIVWGEAREVLYGEQVLPPLSARFRFGEAFLKTTARLDPSQRRALNTNLDQLARLFENPENQNLRSLNFHKLTKPTADGCTHEFYASSEGGAPRCYLREAAGVWQIVRYGEHL